MDESPETPYERPLPELSDPRFLDWVRQQWGMTVERAQDRYLIHGSPERSLSRAVVRDASGACFLLEKFPKRALSGKMRIAQTLKALNDQGLKEVLVPLATFRNTPLPVFKDAGFQMTRFVAGTALERPQWLESRKMGDGMAQFLARMTRRAGQIPVSFPPFSLKTYIYKLFEDMAVRHPGRRVQYLPVLKFLENGFMDAYDGIPLSFCHGDFHPLNMIWKGQEIRAVIDWEFAGIRPACYDAANLIGCAGIEYPEGLAMPMATTFLERLKNSGEYRPSTWRWLPEFVLALRFAWLSEWLRKDDLPMLDLELRYMEILMSHMAELRDIWG